MFCLWNHIGISMYEFTQKGHNHEAQSSKLQQEDEMRNKQCINNTIHL